VDTIGGPLNIQEFYADLNNIGILHVSNIYFLNNILRTVLSPGNVKIMKFAQNFIFLTQCDLRQGKLFLCSVGPFFFNL
jgi:hypothetical protein